MPSNKRSNPASGPGQQPAKRLRTTASTYVRPIQTGVSSHSHFSRSTIALQHPDTITTPLLQSYGLIVNTLHHILICLDCKAVINPAQFRQHVVSQHKSIVAPLNLQDEFDKEVRPQFVFAAFPVPSPTSTVAEIYGIGEPKPAYLVCSKCNHGYAQTRTFRGHTCYQSDATVASFESEVQQFSKNSMHNWFPISRRQTTALLISPWQAFQDQMRDTAALPTEASNTDNYRVLRQILHKERWIQHVHGKDLPKLKELVFFSVKKPPLGGLVKHIHAYLAHVQAQLTDKYIRRLVGTRPTTEYERTFSRHHSDVGWDTHRKYAYVLAGALSLLINNIVTPSDHYSYAVPREISDASKLLLDALKAENNVQEDDSETEDADAEDEEEDEEQGEEDEDEDDQDSVSEAHPCHAYSPSEARPPPKTNAVIQQSLHQLFLLLFRQGAVDNDQFFSTFTRYIVLASVNAKGEWQAAGKITQKIASILFVGRLVFAEELITRKKEDPGMNTLGAFEVAAKPWLQEESESIMPTLYILLRCFLTMRSADDSMLVFNAPDLTGQSAIFGKHQLHVLAIGDALRQLVQEITTELDQLLYHQPDFDIPDSLFIHDEPRGRDAGYGFVADRRNSWTQPDSKTLVQHVINTETLFQRFGFLTADGKFVWQPIACLDYMRRIYKLQELFAVAIILSSGEPARGTELASLLYANVPGGSVRNVFVMFNMLLIRGSYNKTSHATGRDKAMVRVPLVDVGRQLIRFLVHLRPLYSIWQRQFRPLMSTNACHFLFAGLERPVTSEDLSSALCRFSLDKFNIPLRLSIFRQYMAFITACNASLFSAISSPAGTTSAQEQFGHTGEMDRTHYGGDERIPNGIDRYTFMATASVSGVFHMLFGHEAKVLRILEGGNHIRAAHSTTIQAIRHPVPALPVLPSHAPYAATEAVAHAVADKILPSMVHHVNRSIANAHAAVVDIFCPISIKDVSLPIVARHCTHPALLTKLQSFFQSPAGFKNAEQAMATQMMYEGKEHLMYISPTGSFSPSFPGFKVQFRRFRKDTSGATQCSRLGSRAGHTMDTADAVDAPSLSTAIISVQNVERDVDSQVEHIDAQDQCPRHGGTHGTTGV